AHAWGDGTAVPDLTMARSGPGQLSLAGALAMVRAAATNAVFTSSVTGDANPRWQVTADGAHAWGDGTAVPDLTMARSGPGQLSVGGSLAMVRAATTDAVFASSVSGDANPRWQVTADGAHAWGDGTAVPDLTMARSGPGQLSLGSGSLSLGGSLSVGSLAMVRAAATNAVFTSSVTGDANPRWQVTADGAHAWGDGTAVPDLTMARSGPGQLSVGGSLALLGGSASAPGVKFVGGTAGLFSPGADQLAIGTASTERMRIDQTGNVGV